MADLSDLKIKISADVADAQKGLQQTQAGLQAVQTQAQHTGAELDALAAKLAKTQGGSAADWRRIVDRPGVQFAAPAGVAATAAPAAAVATAVTAVTQGAAVAAHELNETTSGISTNTVRIAAGFLGVGLGINLAAGAARLLHQAIAETLATELDLEQSARALAATYGAQATAMTDAARAFTQDPSTRGTATQYLQSANAVHQLTTEYGVNSQQAQQLLQDAGQLAKVQGTELVPTTNALEAAAMGNVRATEQYGISLVDQQGKVLGLGASYEELRQTYGTVAAAQKILGAEHDAIAAQQLNVTSTSHSLADAADALSKSWGNLVLVIGQGLSPTATAALDALDRVLHGYQDPAAATAAAPAVSARAQPVPDTEYRQRAVDQAARAEQEAGAAVQLIQLRQDNNRLAVANDMAVLKTQELTREGEILVVQRQQADLQDRITVASRDNLNTRMTLIAAERAALPASNAVAALNYQQQELLLRAEVSQANVRRGGAPTEDMAALRQQSLELSFQQPEAELAQLRTGRTVQVAQQQSTGQDLARQQTLTTLEGQTRALQDQVFPLQEGQRLTQAQEASLQRMVDLTNLRDTPELTIAQHMADEASSMSIVAAAQERAAKDGATYATQTEQAAAALERAAKAAKDVRDYTGVNNGAQYGQSGAASVSGDGRHSPYAPGQEPEGSSYRAPPTTSTTQIDAPISVNVIGWPDPAAWGKTITDLFNAKMQEFVSGFTTAGIPAPSWLSGFGR